ncbi:uncharacterized protein LOC133923394 [Phragmites australis]|uniref:uncharacterized protein LOC133923394 n=1 Tax=Phragmites australis TaxID=29695 RepID=UPI002D78BF70|nr:uncharacterized protein LOC133923394 [Phragmites australis]
MRPTMVMARSALKIKLVLLLCAAAAAAAASGDVVTYSFPAFDATSTDQFLVATNSSILAPASLVFGSPSLLFPGFNRSEGFLLLLRTVHVWRAGAGGIPDREASFNTSFTLSGASPVAFAILQDSLPPFNGPDGLRGAANYSSFDDAASGSLASVEAGAVRSYGPENTAVGLNVTVTPNRTAPSRTVWIEYDAAAHRLSVYIAGAGQPRPPKALLDTPLGLSGRRTTETAFVGFFAATIQDIIVGVRDWDLTVDRIDGDGKKGTSWWVILVAVLGSVAATAAIVSAVVCYVQSRRRRQLNMQPKI